jgi:piezo-type mechanosensitive ion channel component 1/2
LLQFALVYFKIHPTPNDNRTILNYIEENKIPTSLLFLLVIQFAMIIIDRMLYLRKNMTGKVIFHVFTVLYTHVWMFFILPYFTGYSLNATRLPMVYYIIKCIYMLLSSYQIRCGYPVRISGNFLMKQFNLVSLVAFKV